MRDRALLVALGALVLWAGFLAGLWWVAGRPADARVTAFLTLPVGVGAVLALLLDRHPSRLDE